MPNDDMADMSTHRLDKLLAHALDPVVIPAGRKGPVDEGWQVPRSREDLHATYVPGCNLGALMGRGYASIDLDDDLAREYAHRFLPATEMLGGKSSTPNAHRFFRVVGDIPTRRFQHGATGMCVELLGTGAQVVVDGTHPDTGEPYVLTGIGNAAEATADVLEHGALMLATFVLLARQWPAATSGTRHNLALSLAGFLLKRGCTVEEAVLVIGLAADLADDEEADKRRGAVRDTFRRGKSSKSTGLPHVASILGVDVAQTLARWWNADDKLDHDSAALAAIFEPVEVFPSTDGGLYARVPNDATTGSRIVSVPDELWDYGMASHLREHGRPAAKARLGGMIDALASQARYAGASREVYVRIAGFDDQIHLDADHRNGRVVIVTRAGWEVTSVSDTAFVQRPGMLPIPTPVSGGSVEELRPFVNPGSEDQFRLIIACLLAWLRGRTTFPVLAIHGEQGSGKSSASRRIRTTLDPSVLPTRVTSEAGRDLVLAARNSGILALDNLSHLSPKFSDLLCMIASGTGFATRTMYRDTDETLVHVARPIILNGIVEVANRPDLLSRTILVELPPITGGQRRSERELDHDFEQALPRILGALLDIASQGLAAEPHTRPVEAPRLADTAHWIEACEPALGWEPGTFRRLLHTNEAAKNATALDASPVGMAVLDLMDEVALAGHSSYH